MVYCQSLAGSGHRVRSLAMVRSLVKNFQVCLVNEGREISPLKLPPQLETVCLPGLVERVDSLQPLDPRKSLAEVKVQRRRILHQTLERFRPDCLITEGFPFNRRSLTFELIPLLGQAQTANQPVQIICALPELTTPQLIGAYAQLNQENKTCQLLDQYYDTVVCPKESSLTRLGNYLSRINALNCDLVYTDDIAQVFEGGKAIASSTAHNRPLPEKTALNRSPDCRPAAVKFGSKEKAPHQRT